MKIGGVIIAGGRSSRMGQEKALLDLKGRPVIRWIIDRLAPQVGELAINANGDAGRFADLGLPVLPDAVSVGTPLAGLHAALQWADSLGLDAVITVPSDSPFLPHDLVARLEGQGAAVARSGGHTHYLTGFWPTGLLHLLEVTAEGGVRRVQDWVRHCNARVVEWPDRPYDPFFNVNTPEELAEAERLAAEFAP